MADEGAMDWTEPVRWPADLSSLSTFAATTTARQVELFAVNLNGIALGKRVPLSALDTLAEGPGALPFQLSLMGLDAFGHDVPASAIAMEIGDPDGSFVPLIHTLALSPTTDTPTVQLQGMLADRPGRLACPFDPRAVLARVVERAAATGLTPVLALELEFYLIDPREALPACDPRTGERLARHQIMSLDVMEAFAPVIDGILDAAAALDVPATSTLCEFGPGQFEVNLEHQADALLACDQMVALRRVVRAVARRHGLDATFMAKPFGEASGSGQHLHLSLLDRDGDNVFDEPSGEGPVGERLGAAVAGLIETSADAFLIFAPHLNSFRRHRPGSYAPVGCNWGLDNRGAAVRVPAASGPAARLEHRIAGADANPYLLAAAVIAGALHGLKRRGRPPPISATEASEGAPPFPPHWTAARETFARSPFVADWLGPEFARIYAAMKAQEEETFLAKVSEAELDAYLRHL